MGLTGNGGTSTEGSSSVEWRMGVPKSFACRDDGEFPDCPVVVRGETDEEVIRQAI